MADARELIAEIERGVELPSGTDERFNGYGVMGLPFASGHVLSMRRFPASSIGDGYFSIWHRDPDGRWSMFQNVPPAQACPRYFGSIVAEAGQRDIAMTWTGPMSFSITMGAGTKGDALSWDVSLGSSPAIGMMNAIGGIMPDAMWRSPAVLKLMAAVAGPVLGTGRMNLVGEAPNGQDFIANPLHIWSIPESKAAVNGEDLGPVGPLAEQASLGDFMIPQRGMFVIGRAFFENFDETQHSSATTQAANP